MSVSEIQLYQILKNKLGEKEAEELVSFVKAEIKSEYDNKRKLFIKIQRKQHFQNKPI